jgi:phosphoribosylanthranilate isomerase
MRSSPSAQTRTWTKICGVRDAQSALNAVKAGADAIGLNFVRWSKRYVTAEQALAIANEVRGTVELVGVVEDASLEQAGSLREQLGLDRIQFHFGATGPNGLKLPDWAYIAVGVASPDDIHAIENLPGSVLLVDACVAGRSGGTGTTYDWSWVVDLARRRQIILAGGLTPANVGEAVARVSPWGVDVASGVEFAGRPGSKDPNLVSEFIRNARALR